MGTWIEEELATLDMGDKRLNKRMAIIVDRLAAKPTATLPGAFRSWAELQAAYRFFSNQATTPMAVLASHVDATIGRIQKQRVALLDQDTTELDLTRKVEVVEGAGPLTHESRSGFFLHPVVAFTADRLPLGTIHADWWGRDPEDLHKSLWASSCRCWRRWAVTWDGTTMALLGLRRYGSVCSG